MKIQVELFGASRDFSDHNFLEFDIENKGDEEIALNGDRKDSKPAGRKKSSTIG